MARITNYEVETVLETDASINLRPYIEVAHILTDRVSACATELGITLSDEQLEAIETYLAAHFYALRDQQYTSKSTGNASASFQGQTAMQLDYTPYGQMAKVLDESGCLTAMGSGSRARMTWLGKPPSSQIDYEDRD